MTRKQKRLSLILGGLAVIGLALGLVLYAMRSNVAFFRTPGEITSGLVAKGERVRLGGMVVKGSIKKGPGTLTTFRLTDKIASITVKYDGILPDLFGDGQGAVTEGKLQDDGTFTADTVLAKHDEKYMPRELADSLRKQGVQLPEGNIQ